MIRVHEETDARQFVHANTSGVTIKAFDRLGKEGVVRIGNRYGLALADIENLASGTLYTAGTFSFCKQAGDVFTVGQTLGWDAANKRVTTDLKDGRLGTVEEAAGNGTTKVAVMLTFEDAQGFADAIDAASAIITNTLAATFFDKNVSIPANSLRVGDVIHVQGSVIVLNQNSTDTLTLGLFLGATSLWNSGAIDVATGDIGVFSARLTVRSIGAGGTVFAEGDIALGVAGTVTRKATVKSQFVVDTTVAQLVQSQATWSVAHANNQVRLESLAVKVERRGKALA